MPGQLLVPGDCFSLPRNHPYIHIVSVLERTWRLCYFSVPSFPLYSRPHHSAWFLSSFMMGSLTSKLCALCFCWKVGNGALLWKKNRKFLCVMGRRLCSRHCFHDAASLFQWWVPCISESFPNQWSSFLFQLFQGCLYWILQHFSKRKHLVPFLLLFSTQIFPWGNLLGMLQITV